jgi:hypothetical protein
MRLVATTAADDAHAAERERGILPAFPLPPESSCEVFRRPGGCEVLLLETA